MAVQIMIWSILVIIAVIVGVAVYIKTKSLAKVGYLFEIILPIVVFFISFQISDSILIVAINLLGLGILINGLIGLLK